MPIAQDGSGNIAVVVPGDNNSVTIMRGEAQLTLLQRHKRRREPRKHLDLLDPYSRANDLVGREDDLGALEAWLASARPIGVRCLTGRAGSGKTRLALELCESAEGSGWLTGFVHTRRAGRVPAAAASGELALAAADARRGRLRRRFRSRAATLAGAAGRASGRRRAQAAAAPAGAACQRGGRLVGGADSGSAASAAPAWRICSIRPCRLRCPACARWLRGGMY